MESSQILNYDHQEQDGRHFYLHPNPQTKQSIRELHLSDDDFSLLGNPIQVKVTVEVLERADGEPVDGQADVRRADTGDVVADRDSVVDETPRDDNVADDTNDTGDSEANDAGVTNSEAHDQDPDNEDALVVDPADSWRQ